MAIENVLAGVEANKAAILEKAAAAGIDGTAKATEVVTAAFTALAQDNPIAPYFDAHHADAIYALTQDVVAKAGGAEAYAWKWLTDGFSALLKKVEASL